MLKDIRNALIQKVENPYFYVKSDPQAFAEVDPIGEIAFAEALNAVGGQFVYCTHESEMLKSLLALVQECNWHEIWCLNPPVAELLDLAGVKVAGGTKVGMMDDMDVSLTTCEALIARTGSVLVSSVASDARRMYSYPEVHLVMAYASQVVPDIGDAYKLILARYGENIPSMITMITGPSRTADIEKTLVMGAHGPKQLIVFMIDDINHPLPND